MTNSETRFSFEQFRIGRTLWHVDSYFLIQKEQEAVEEIMQERGLSWEDYYYKISPEERKNIGWEEREADEDGFFIFPRGKLILGHTKEDVEIPRNRHFRMTDIFVTTHGVLPLRTNSAPLIHPGSRGPQTYEIINVGDCDLKLRVSDLSCPVDIFALDHDSALTGVKDGNNFSIQERGCISLGRLSRK